VTTARNEKGEARSGGRSGGLDRREALAAFGLGALGVALPSWQQFLSARAAGSITGFLTAEERALVTVLADMIIPRDQRSGSASDSGAIDYMDFVLSESDEKGKAAIRRELRWYDEECTRRFGRIFVQCSDTERGRLLDDIAWPARTRPELKQHAEYFNRIRDLTASAFFSSRMGVEDLGYMGNVLNPGWNGAPPEALEGLGVNYDEWDRKYGGLQ
jgi:hypothetical protein